MAQSENKIVKIIPAENGKYFAYTKEKNLLCKDADAVGEGLEELIWPILAPLLESNKPITIIISNGTD